MYAYLVDRFDEPVVIKRTPIFCFTKFQGTDGLMNKCNVALKFEIIVAFLRRSHSGAGGTLSFILQRFPVIVYDAYRY